MLRLEAFLHVAGGLGRAIWLAVIILSGCPAVVPAVPTVQEIRVVGIPGAGGLGEVWRYTAEGRLVSRWTGLSDIGSLSVTGAGRLVVFQQGNLRLVEFDGSGIVQHVLSLPFTSVFQGTVLSNGHLLLAAGKDGAVELDGAGHVIWRAPAPDAGAEVVATVRLADGTTLCAARNAGGSLYGATAGSTALAPVTLSGVGPFKDLWQRPKLRLLDPAVQRVALTYEPWPDWHRLDWGKGIVQRRSVIPAKGGVRAIAPGRGGVTWVAETPFEVIRVSPSGSETERLSIAEEIRDIAGADDGGVFVAVERWRDPERPAHRPPSPDHQPFSWMGLGLWILGSILFIGALQVIVWRKAPSEDAETSTPKEPLSGPSLEQIHSHPRAWTICVFAVAAGLAMATAGCIRLHEQRSFQALPYFLPGVLLIAAASQWWLRVICGQRDHWWVQVRAARFPKWLLLPTWCVVATLLAGSFLLWRWRSRGIHENASISLWASLQILCVGLTVLSPRRPGPHKWRIPGETLLHVAVLLLLASIALSIDLAGVPQNVHNDVGLTVDNATRLLEGRADHFFGGGYAEIPYAGHLPTSLGLLIAGKTVAGSRWGGMLMGFLAVLGTYVLGREYKSARLGLFAAILLLASIPFLHFSRSTPFGEVAAYSVWLLYLLLRAARTAHLGTWLILGVVGGWGLFLFYSARVALAGMVVAGVLLSLRSPRVTIRRWYGPLLFVLAFAVTVIPMAPYWRSHPGAFSHRMDTSFALYDPQTGFHRDVLARAVGEPFVKTLGMFYTERDASGQGTLSPAAGPIEATLLSIGLAAVLADGWGVNIACLGWFVMMLLGCGVFAQATPWYTRLVPVTPVVSLFMARAIDLQLDLIRLKHPLWRWVVTAVVSAALIGGVVAKNLKTYLNYERARPSTEFTAFGRAALALGPKYQFYCVTFQRPDFSCLNGSFVPYLATLDVHDLRDPVRAMPFPAGRAAAIMIPFARSVPRPLDPKALVNEIVLSYPEAKLQYVHGNQSGSDPPIGVVVVVSP
jgi:Dolichyl-phosphate-mannose-protein mannosyltransferase